jgi:hypothetical protein
VKERGRISVLDTLMASLYWFKYGQGYQHRLLLALSASTLVWDEVETRASVDTTAGCKPLRIKAISSLNAFAFDRFSANWFKVGVVRDARSKSTY